MHQSVDTCTNRQAHRVRFPGPKSRDKNFSRLHHNRDVLADNPITSLVCILCGIFLCASPPAIPMYHHPSRLRLEMRGSPSFSPEIRDAPPIPLGIRCPGYITPWANQMTYHAAHAPRPGRTQDCDEIWRHFCLFISATDIEPGAPNDWYKYQPTRLNCHLIRCQFGGR